MKKILLIPILTVSTLLFSSCQTTTGSYSNTKTGAGTGAILGSGFGAVIGHQSGETGEGALIGAAAGSLLGGLFGSAKDSQQRRADLERDRQREQMIQQAKLQQEQAELERKNNIALGSRIEDPHLLAARQKAELAEAEVLRIKKEQQENIRKAKELEEYNKRVASAQAELEQLNQ